MTQTRASDRQVTYWLQATAFLAPLAGIAAPLGLAPLSMAMAAGVLFACRHDRPWAKVPVRYYWVLGLIIAWMLISVLWAQDPRIAVTSSMQMAAAGFCGLVVTAAVAGHDSGRGRGVFLAMLAGSVLALAVLYGEFLSGNYFSYLRNHAQDPSITWLPLKSRFSRGATFIVLLLWPLALLLARRWNRWPAIGMMAVTLAVFSMGSSGSSRLGLLAGLATFAAAYFWPVAALRIMRLFVVVLAVAIPVLTSLAPSPDETAKWPFIPNSSHHRLTIWSFAAKNALEHPLRGWGMEASRTIPGADDEITVEIPQSNGAIVKIHEPQLPLHPHNNILQWWLELGAVGVILMTAFLWLVLDGIGRMADRAERSVFAAMFATIYAISLVSYGAWQMWWLCGIEICVVLCAASLSARGGRMTAPVDSSPS